ncbi:MAG: purine-nucleoside phosphorylase [Proteobacteria bacterium]|nr:purine-nucleoside phosphorylase [Pseudomonadota bacterium]
MATSTERERAVQALRAVFPGRVDVAVVLGSGLAAVTDMVQDSVALPYERVAGMPATGVSGHRGCFVFGYCGPYGVVFMQGRTHLYEGRSPDEVVYGVRLMLELGARVLVVTNAAGGIRRDLDSGELMLIEDHLNLTGCSCLVTACLATVKSEATASGAQNLGGPNERFVDMIDAYDVRLREKMRLCASALGIELKQGVYAGVLGPSYETPAEVRMLRTLGADAVGMSTVQEVIAARQCGACCVGLSVISNPASDRASAPLKHEDVQSSAGLAVQRLRSLLAHWLHSGL